MSQNEKQPVFFSRGLSHSDMAGLATFIVIMSLLITIIIGTITSTYRKENEVFVEIMFDEIDEIDKEIEQKIKEVPPSKAIETHLGYNRAEILKELDDFQPLDEIIESKENSSVGKNDVLKGNYNIMMLSEERILKSRKILKQISTRPKEVKKTSSVSYYLEDRHKIVIPAPIYTCNASGVVAIDIKVNNKGRVINASFNPSGSSSNSSCLLDKAVSYAKRATFNSVEKPKTQTGTITYNFENRTH